ncbi:hypothetical protein ACKXGF_07515 [Alkalibacillus sp. S2W]|uniref:hypothetical protein n=1 Tax=Alkalibacillus sp. S2W TaxID=3386553 RepID=UPI00398D1256
MTVRIYDIGIAKFVPGEDPEMDPGTIEKTPFAEVNEEGVRLMIEAIRSEKQTYKSGGAIHDIKVNGANIKIAFSTYDYSLDTMARALPYFEFDEENETLNFTVANGYSLRKNAYVFYATPLDVSDDSEDIIFYKGNVVNDPEFTFHGVEDQAYEVEVQAFPVTFLVDGKPKNKYGKIGSWEDEFIDNEGSFENQQSE